MPESPNDVWKKLLAETKKSAGSRSRKKAEQHPSVRPVLPPGKRYEISFPFATPSLNVTKGEHWSKKTKRRQLYERYIWASKPCGFPAQVRLEIFRHGTRSLDFQNHVGGTKCLVDGLVNMGVIVDDNESIIVERHYEQVKVMKKEQEMTVVVVTDLTENNHAK